MKPSQKLQLIKETKERLEEAEYWKRMNLNESRSVEIAKLSGEIDKLSKEIEEIDEFSGEIEKAIDMTKLRLLTERKIKLLEENLVDYNMTEQRNKRMRQRMQDQEDRKKHRLQQEVTVATMKPEFETWIQKGLTLVHEEFTFDLTLPAKLSSLDEEMSKAAIQSCFDDLNNNDKTAKYSFCYHRETIEPYEGVRPCVMGWVPPPPTTKLAYISVSIESIEYV